MKLDAATDTIAITIESSGEPLKAVRFERADGSNARVAIRVENGAVVVTCGPDTILEGPPERKRRLLPPPDSLATIGDADWHPATPTVTRVAVPIEVELLPPEDAPRPRPPVAPQAFDPGDAPTRIEYHPPSESAVAAPPSVAAPSAPFAPSAPSTPPATKGPRIRRSVRRFALLAMLAASWMLWFHAYRGRHAHASRASAAGSASPANPASPSAASGSPVAGKLAAQDTLSSGTATSPPPHASNVTEARAAADALANGDSASAVKLYDDLASKSASNPAYAEVARSLRARANPLPP